MVDGLQLDESVAKQALRIFRLVLDSEYSYSHLDDLSAACLYGAVRIMRKPVTIRDISDVARVREKRLSTVTKNVFNAVDFDLPPQRPEILVESYLNDIGIPEQYHSNVRELVEAANEHTELRNKANTTIVGSAIYAGSVLYGYECSQKEVCQSVGTTQVTIRNNYKIVLDQHENEVPRDQRRFTSFNSAVETLTADLDLPELVVERVDARVKLAKHDLSGGISVSGLVLGAIYVTLEEEGGYDDLVDVGHLETYAVAQDQTIRKYVDYFS
ncbi:hypothetical protein ACLI4U_02060 [Natrialbaceae archaeon A-CW2]|uniref:hypothetical protein n=1 Tax=Natronosalvus amylolyticus TaxID=2961994 RepID=UPI0020C96DC4|nr:hypothetical protein [Natronosalvus amylolyticus]